MKLNRQNILDRIFGRALTATKFFQDGVGKDKTIEHLIDVATTYHDPGQIQVSWIGKPRHSSWATHHVGMFQSPAAKLLELPALVRPAYFELVMPRGMPLDMEIPICIHLAATSDEKFARRRILARPLLKKGIGAIILENPYYGWRRPRGQQFVAIRSLADQLKMSIATMHETHGLARWLLERGYNHVGVTGYSMGGFMAAYAATQIPFPVATVLCAAGASAAEPFTLGELSPAFDWESIQEDLGIDDRGEAKSAMGDIFEAMAIDALPLPVDLDPVIFVSGKHDAIVSPTNTRRLAEHWNDSPVRWINSGHISGIWRGMRTYLRSIEDAFGILLAKYPDGV